MATLFQTFARAASGYIYNKRTIWLTYVRYRCIMLSNSWHTPIGTRLQEVHNVDSYTDSPVDGRHIVPYCLGWRRILVVRCLPLEGKHGPISPLSPNKRIVIQLVK